MKNFQRPEKFISFVHPAPGDYLGTVGTRDGPAAIRTIHRYEALVMKHSMTAVLRHAPLVLGATLVTGMLTAQAVAEEQTETPLTMIVLKDTAYGISIASGNYQRAISKLTASVDKGRSKFATYNNLCVAYAKAKELDNAIDACDAALAAVKKRESSYMPKSRGYDLSYAQYQADLAVALSNRGVLLAVAGNESAATQAFEDAISLDTKYSSNIEGNLERLESRAVPDSA